MRDAQSALEQLNHCSRCGGCQAVCPLYAETRSEPLVARGKIYLLKSHLEGSLELSPKMKEIMSLCLLCKACVNQCPNKIPVDRLVLEARQTIAAEKGISFVKKNVFQHLLKNNGRLSLAARLGYLYQHSGIQWLVRKSRILEALGRDLARKERLLPEMAAVPFRRQVPRLIASNRPRYRVAYFTGCMTNFISPATGRAVLEVLKHQQLEVLIPEQYCCGIPALSSGDEATTVELARMNIEVFHKAKVDAVITDCASCGSMLRDYGNLVGTPEAREFSSKVMDLSQLLTDLVEFQPGDQEVPATVTYHDPCHLRRGQGVAEAPRKLIKTLPGVVFTEMKEADRCCGAAGSFNLTYYDLSTRVGRRKVENIKNTGADTVVTGCPSCITQIAHHLEMAGSRIKVMHLAELLSRSYAGERR